MRKRFMQKVQGILPNKMLRREKFSKRIKNQKRHIQRYNVYSYRHGSKASHFNRWQDYKRMTNRTS